MTTKPTHLSPTPSHQCRTFIHLTKHIPSSSPPLFYFQYSTPFTNLTSANSLSFSSSSFSHKPNGWGAKGIHFRWGLSAQLPQRLLACHWRQGISTFLFHYYAYVFSFSFSFKSFLLCILLLIGSRLLLTYCEPYAFGFIDFLFLISGVSLSFFLYGNGKFWIWLHRSLLKFPSLRIFICMHNIRGDSNDFSFILFCFFNGTELKMGSVYRCRVYQRFCL